MALFFARSILGIADTGLQTTSFSSLLRRLLTMSHPKPKRATKDQSAEPSRLASAQPQAQDGDLSAAWQAFTDGDLKRAERMTSQLAKTHADHPHLLYLRGLIALGDNRIKAGLGLLNRVKGAPELSLPVALAKGQALLHLGQASDAMSAFQDALSYKPDDATAHYWLAMSLLAQEDLAAGRQYLRRAILLEPGLGAAHYELGVLSLGAGDGKSALSAFAAARSAMPDSPQVLNNLGLAQQMSGDLAAAIRSFERAIELNGNYAEAWFNLGVCQRAEGQAAAATRSLDKAVLLAPELRKHLKALNATTR